MREEIEAKIQHGLSDDAIVEGFVGRLGKAVLSAPPAKGGYVVVWVLPFCLLIAGAIGIGWGLVAQKKRQRPGSIPGEPGPGLNKDEEKKFNEEWDRWNRQS